MTDFKALPIGIEDFAEMRQENYYYVDKTGMIIELLKNKGKANLFTRPRRFGKSLNMSMLKYFFEIGTDKTLFDGLAVCKEKDLCEKHMGQYPVIHLTLKQVSGNNFEEAKEQMWTAIMEEAIRFDYLQNSFKLNERDKEAMFNLTMGIGNLYSSIRLMSRILSQEYDKKVIILIDEYDVPLQKAEQLGYYSEMVLLISQMFGYGMKTNPSMEFAVITGCLKIAKESIFTGFNNVKSHSIINTDYEEWFGFTDEEIQDLLKYYGKSEYYDLTKSWYDGYRFGDMDVYCPWDVVNWCYEMVARKNYVPQNFWANTSSNNMIIRFADRANYSLREELSAVIEGNSIWKAINQELTYGEMYHNVENLWSILLMTGYLTVRQFKDGKYELVIPNREIKTLFQQLMKIWFTQKVMEDNSRTEKLFHAIDTQNVKGIEDYIHSLLRESISCWDGGKLEQKESFYHGLMLGVLNTRDGWATKSNRESGDGRLDIVTYPEDLEEAVIFEFKYAQNGKLEQDAENALKQISQRKYDEYFIPWYPKRMVHYGIAFYKKYCRVLSECSECVE